MLIEEINIKILSQQQQQQTLQIQEIKHEIYPNNITPMINTSHPTKSELPSLASVSNNDPNINIKSQSYPTKTVYEDISLLVN